MKKRIVFLLVTSLIMGISGCGQRDKEEATQTTIDITDEDTVLNEENKQVAEDRNLLVSASKTELSDPEPTSTIDVSTTSNIPEGDTALYETDFVLNESRTAKIKLYGKKTSEYFYGISYVEFSWNHGFMTGFSTSEAVQNYWSDTMIDYTDYTEAYHEDGGLMVGDFNFDGYTDIGLQIQTTAYNMPYIYWFYNADTDNFDYYGSFLCFLEVDEISQVCIVEYREAQTYYTDTYRPDDQNGLYLTKRDITEYIDGKETHKSETYP